MTGKDSLLVILNKVKEIDNIWDLALDGMVLDLDSIISGRNLQVSNAKISWSDIFDDLFINGYNTTGFIFNTLFKAKCNIGVNTKIEFNGAGTNAAAYFYPNCVDWINEDYAKQYLIENIANLLNEDNISTEIYLDDIIMKSPFICYDASYDRQIKYNMAKLGYMYELSTCNTWYQATPAVNPIPLCNVIQETLADYFYIAMKNEDPYYQYLDFYHIIEFKYYDGVFKKLVDLRMTSAKDFFDYLKKTKTITELMMFSEVMSQVSNTSFTEQLNVSGIIALDPTLETKYSSKNTRLLPNDKSTWVDFLYQIRCGIVHSKEDEITFERSTTNEQLLYGFVLPYISKLAAYFVENN